jgi:hypothetical protein
MFDLFSKFDITFFLTLAISLLIGGAIFYYCFTRLNILEESVINQGKILQSFISGQVNLIPHPLTSETQQEEPSPINDKIDISDDESDDESDDDDDNEINVKNLHKIQNAENESDCESSDDDDDDDNNNEPYNNLKIDNHDLKHVTQVGILDLGGSINPETTGVAILGHILDMERISATVMDTSLEKTEDIKIVDVSKDDLITDVTENDENKKKKSLSKMSNKELKDLIIKKNLGNESDIKNLQKKELLEIIQNENQSIIEQ